MRDNNVAGPDSRKLTVMLNVHDMRKLPQAGKNLAKFITELSNEHGLFTTDIVMSVEPTVYTSLGPAEMPADEGDFEIVFVPEREDD
ncbi:hypothetical protein [Paenibacillus sp. TC-CSREp1]|uniref:hypothetical protein n=1 Tax=Paenibacillus sp. TC-CSREp1 TaxID=3410089 RepID=UPI003CF42CBB